MFVCFCRSFTPPSTLYRSFRRRASTLPVRANLGCEGLNVPAEKPRRSRKILPTRASKFELTSSACHCEAPSSGGNKHNGFHHYTTDAGYLLSPYIVRYIRRRAVDATLACPWPRLPVLPNPGLGRLLHLIWCLNSFPLVFLFFSFRLVSSTMSDMAVLSSAFLKRVPGISIVSFLLLC